MKDFLNSPNYHLFIMNNQTIFGYKNISEITYIQWININLHDYIVIGHGDSGKISEIDNITFTFDEFNRLSFAFKNQDDAVFGSDGKDIFYKKNKLEETFQIEMFCRKDKIQQRREITLTFIEVENILNLNITTTHLKNLNIINLEENSRIFSTKRKLLMESFSLCKFYNIKLNDLMINFVE